MNQISLESRPKFNFWYILLAIWALILAHDLYVSRDTLEIPYSEFSKLAKEGKVDNLLINQESLQGSFKNPEPGQPKTFFTVRVDPEISEQLSGQNIKYQGLIESTFVRTLLSWLVPMLIFFAFWSYLFRRLSPSEGFGKSLLSVGRSNAKIYAEESTKIKLADVAGVDEAKEELQEIITFLRDPENYGRLGGRLPKGILLVGPPGTGKTLLAKAVAGEAKVPFFSISGSEFVEMFVGIGAARVRDLFEQARKAAPCIVFIDELDALGRARGFSYPGGGNDEKEQTLNQLLAELDGFDSSIGVVLLAATNRPEILDPALLRAGRFDRQILVDRPDKKGRLQILQIHIRKITGAEKIDLEQVAAMTTGFSGADLANLVNEAALLATRRKANSVAMEDFAAAIERSVAGLEKKNRILSQEERTTVAFHEMGHAVVALSLPGSDSVVKISIIPRGIGALGYTIQRPTDDRYLMSKQELQNKMAVLLGGRAAEDLVFSRISTGAADDLVRVTDIARSMAMRFGMEKQLGLVAYETEPVSALRQPLAVRASETKFYSEDTAREIDNAVRDEIARAYSIALQILTSRRALLDEGAKLLLEKETLQQEELKILLNRFPTTNEAYPAGTLLPISQDDAGSRTLLND